jgi:hypothetical protein
MPKRRRPLAVVVQNSTPPSAPPSRRLGWTPTTPRVRLERRRLAADGVWWAQAPRTLCFRAFRPTSNPGRKLFGRVIRAARQVCGGSLGRVRAGRGSEHPTQQNGGGGGIRTPGSLPTTADFKSAAIDHSATPPVQRGHSRGTPLVVDQVRRKTGRPATGSDALLEPGDLGRSCADLARVCRRATKTARPTRTDPAASPAGGPGDCLVSPPRRRGPLERDLLEWRHERSPAAVSVPGHRRTHGLLLLLGGGLDARARHGRRESLAPRVGPRRRRRRLARVGRGDELRCAGPGDGRRRRSAATRERGGSAGGGQSSGALRRSAGRDPLQRRLAGGRDRRHRERGAG